MNREGGWHRTVTGVVRRTLEAAYEDNIPFLASAVAFDILLTAIPFVGLVLAVVGYLAQNQLALQQLNVHELLAVGRPVSSASSSARSATWSRGAATSRSSPRPCSCGSRLVCSEDCARH